MNKTFTNDQAIAALKKAEQSTAWARVSAYVIINPNATFHASESPSSGGKYGKIKVLHPAGGYGTGKVKCFVWLANNLEYFEGYDLDACIAQMDFWGDKVKDSGSDWRYQLESVGYTVIRAI